MMEDALQKYHSDISHATWEPQGSVSPSSRSHPRFSHDPTFTPISKEQLGTENAIMRLEARKRLVSPEFLEQRRARQALPAWRERQKVTEAVSSNSVVVLTGETGCGKTTQVSVPVCCVLHP